MAESEWVLLGCAGPLLAGFERTWAAVGAPLRSKMRLDDDTGGGGQGGGCRGRRSRLCPRGPREPGRHGVRGGCPRRGEAHVRAAAAQVRILTLRSSGRFSPICQARLQKCTDRVRTPRVPKTRTRPSIGKGCWVGPSASRSGEQHRPARRRLRGHNELLAVPTCPAPTQAAELGRLDSLSSPPVSWEKMRSSLEDGKGGLKGRRPSLNQVPFRLDCKGAEGLLGKSPKRLTGFNSGFC